MQYYVMSELFMPVGLLEPTNIYFVLKALGRQLLIFSCSVCLESTVEVFLESLSQRLHN